MIKQVAIFGTEKYAVQVEGEASGTTIDVSAEAGYLANEFLKENCTGEHPIQNIAITPVSNSNGVITSIVISFDEPGDSVQERSHVASTISAQMSKLAKEKFDRITKHNRENPPSRSRRRTSVPPPLPIMEEDNQADLPPDGGC